MKPEPTMRELREKYCGKIVVIDGKRYRATPYIPPEIKQKEAGFSLILIAAVFIAFSFLAATMLQGKMIMAPITAEQDSRHRLGELSSAIAAYALINHKMPMPTDAVSAGGSLIAGGVPQEILQYGSVYDVNGIVYTVDSSLTALHGVSSQRIGGFDFTVADRLSTRGLRVTKFDGTLQ